MLTLVLAATVTVLHVQPVPPAPDCLPRPQATSSSAPLRAQRLASLPDANMVLAVERSVGGCGYQQVVGFNVSTHAPAPTDGMHVQGWRGTLVPDNARLTPATPAAR